MTRYPEHVAYRVMLMAPFVAVLLLGVALGFAAVDSRGVNEGPGYTDDTPMLGGLIVALPVMVYATWAMIAISRRTARPFALHGWRMAFGLLPLVGICECLGWYAVLIDETWFYYDIDVETSEFMSRPSFTVTEFYTLALFAAFVFPMGVFGALSKVLYVDAIKRAGEPAVRGHDPMGEIARTGGAFPTP